MKKNILKNQKGITLIIVMITIVILGLLCGMAVTHLDTGKDIKEYNYMCADIELLETKIMTYYENNSTLPVKGGVFDAGESLHGQASSRDNSNYYLIDVSLLNGVTLKFGGGTKENGDVYIVNEQSHEIYYLNGIMIDNVVRHK